MKNLSAISSLLVTFAVTACGGKADWESAQVPLQYAVDFNTESAGWTGGFSDYTTGTKPTDVVTESRTLPAPFTGKGFYTFGTNRSDDLFIYIKKKITGFAPNTKYALRFQANIISNVATGCYGVGGSPGDSVYFFGGASVAEPVTIQKGDDFLMNLDRGAQATSGKSALVLGTIGNASSDCGHAPYLEKKLNNATPLEVTTDASGALWLLFGIDSGFEAASQIYYKSIAMNATPILR